MSVWKYEKTRVMTQRMIGLAVVFVLMGCIIIGRLFYLQVLQGEKYLLLAEKNRISVRLTMPSRGTIYDRNGVKLAENAKTFQAVLIKEEARDYRQTLDRFLKLIPLDEDEVSRIQKELRWKRAFMPVRIKDNLSFDEMTLLQLNAPDLPGIQIEEGMMRFYPAGTGNTHVVGYVSLLTEKDVAGNTSDPLLDLPGYRIGRTGIESSMEAVLKGKPGVRKSEINAMGRTVRVLEETPPESGQDVFLTIDSRLQNYATRLMARYAASAVVINVRTGEILALVSTPSFDANLFTVPISVKNWNKLLHHKYRPLQNKVLSGLYSPGSIFKLVVGLAGLESGVITASSKVDCQGKIKLGSHFFHCWKKNGHGSMTLEQALMHSCDVYFYEMAQKIGADKIIETARKLGFGEALNVGLNSESSGLLPTSDWKLRRFNDAWRMGDTLNLSIGQGFLNATPLQIATAVARIAGGRNLHPTLLKSNVESSVEQLDFKEYYLKLIRSGMYDVVNRVGGTAYAVRINVDGQKMAGKTATTQVRRISLKEREEGVKSQDDLPEKYRDHAIFAAFAPTDKPKYAAVVLVEHGGGGSRTAAPLMKQLMQYVLELDKSDKKELKK